MMQQILVCFLVLSVASVQAREGGLRHLLEEYPEYPQDPDAPVSPQITQAPTREPAVNAEEAPVVTTQAPVITTTAPITTTTTEAPITTTEAPVVVPLNTTTAVPDDEGATVDTSGPLIDYTEDPVTEAPVVTTQAPIATTQAPVITTTTAPPTTTQPPQLLLVPNQVCTGAFALPPSDWTLATGMGPQVVASGTLVGMESKQQVLIMCGGPMMHYGVWYTVMGTGEIFTVSTCHTGTTFPTLVSVYTGDCSSLECLARNNNAPTGSFGAGCSRTQWQSQSGVTYQILVRSEDSSLGNLELSLEGSFYNDVCPNARPAYIGWPLVGDTTTGQDATDLLAQCGYTEKDWHIEFANLYPDRRPRALWYKVLGTGGRMMATTCNPQGDTFYQAHRIHVYRGDACGGDCVGGDIAKFTCSTYEWDTTLGAVYHVAVHKTYGILESNPAPAVFTLTIAEVGGGGGTAITRQELFN